MICTWCRANKVADEFYAGCLECRTCRMDRQKAAKKMGRVAFRVWWSGQVRQRQLDWFAEYRTSLPAFKEPRGNEEQWRPIPGYEGLYEISSHGRVRSLCFSNINGWRVRREPKIIKLFHNRLGYPYFTLARDGTRKTAMVWQMVLTAFRGPRPEGLVAGHRDGNPSNCRLDNLDWISYVENEADKKRHGRNLAGAKNHQAKLTDRKVVEMRELRAKGFSLSVLSHSFGVSVPVVAKVCKRQSWKHVP